MTTVTGRDVEQVSAIRVPKRRWRRLTGWWIAILLVAAAIGVPAWWRSSAESMSLEPGYFSTSPGAWEIRAGSVVEECFGIVPGSVLTFGVSFDNNNSRPIYLTNAEQPFLIFPTAISMRRINLRSSEPEGPEEPFAPLLLKPGDEVMLLFTLQVPPDVEMSEGVRSSFSAITMDYRAMNIHFEKEVPIGYLIGFDRPSPGDQPCQPDHH